MVLEYEESPIEVSETLPKLLLGRNDNQLVSENEPLIDQIIKANWASLFFPGCILDYGDHYTAGMMGLMEAARSYDPERCVKFSTFAWYRIRGSIFDHLRKASDKSRSMMDRFKMLDEASKSLEAEFGRTPTQEELCDLTGLSMATVREWHNSLSYSLEARTSEDANLSLADSLELSLSEEHRLTVEDFRELVLSRLPERLYGVVRLYYFEDKNSIEIGAIYGVHDSRIRQLIREARDIIAERLDELELTLDDFDLSSANELLPAFSVKDPFEQFCQEKIAEERVPVEVARFIYDHPDGCLPTAGAVALGYQSNAFSRGKDRIRLSPAKTGRRQIIPQYELIRLAILKYCWVPYFDVANEIEASYGIRMHKGYFRTFVESGRLGDTRENIYGQLCIRAEFSAPDGIRDAHTRYKAVMSHGKHNHKRRLREGEYSASELSMMVDISQRAFVGWCAAGKIKHHIIKNARSMKTRDILNFIEQVKSGDIRVKPSVVTELIKLEAILTAD